MSRKIVCDRCGTEDDPHNRHIEVEYVGPYPLTPMNSKREEYDLCGYCAARFRLFLTDDFSRADGPLEGMWEPLENVEEPT